MCCIVPSCQFGFRLYFLLFLVVLGIEFICMLFICSSVLQSYTPSSEMWLFIGLLSQPDLFPKRPLGWSRFQFLSVLKPGCLGLFEVLSSWGQVLSAEVSHSPTLLQAARAHHRPWAGQPFCYYRPSLYFLYLATLSFPWENVNPCWQCREETGKAQVQGLPRLQSSKPAWTTKASSCFQRSWGWRWVTACLPSLWDPGSIPSTKSKSQLSSFLENTV